MIDLKSEKEKCVFSSLVRQISPLTWLDQTLREAGLFEHKDCVFCEDYGWMEEKEDADGGDFSETEGSLFSRLFWSLEPLQLMFLAGFN